MAIRNHETFDIIPAIDLRAGRVVRLEEGDFGRERIYRDNPAEVASGFGAAGAMWIHVVDLDGARAGERRQTAAIAAIRRVLGSAVRLQVGGGLRSAEAVAETLAAGADRVVLGTAALDDPRMVRRAIDDHGVDRIAVALDIRDGIAVGHGWVATGAGRPLEVVVQELDAAGVGTFVVTAVDRDGLLGGPDLALLGRVHGLTDAAIVASGGIATIEDLVATRAIGCRGAIIGRALYEGRIELTAAIVALR